mmetsp:Transcript_3931/g.11293  ORF Transcript_3931/g.11293 Transcript_3931/m.11293 type:complete len:229 (+) Transcript_3931:1235-1921(+)
MHHRLGAGTLALPVGVLAAFAVLFSQIAVLSELVFVRERKEDACVFAPGHACNAFQLFQCREFCNDLIPLILLLGDHFVQRCDIRRKWARIKERIIRLVVVPVKVLQFVQPSRHHALGRKRQPLDARDKRVHECPPEFPVGGFAAFELDLIQPLVLLLQQTLKPGFCSLQLGADVPVPFLQTVQPEPRFSESHRLRDRVAAPGRVRNRECHNRIQVWRVGHIIKQVRP